MDDVTAEKFARNNSIFRDANQQIASTAVEHGMGEARLVPLICECSDPGCTQVLTMRLSEYRAVRADPRRFVHASGHEPEVEGALRTVEKGDGFLVVEKTGHAGDVASELAEDAPPLG